MAGAAWPETSEPTNRPMAQNGSTPSTLTKNTVTHCAEAQRHVCDEHRERRSCNNVPMPTKIMAMTMRASR